MSVGSLESRIRIMDSVAVLRLTPRLPAIFQGDNRWPEAAWLS